MNGTAAWTINGANGVKLVAESERVTSVLIGASRAEQLEENGRR